MPSVMGRPPTRQLGTMKKMTLNRKTLRALEAGEMQGVNGANTLQVECTEATICVSCRSGSTCL